MILETKLLKNENHQTRVSLLLELVNDAYLTVNRTRYMWSSTQETTPLDHASPTTSVDECSPTFIYVDVVGLAWSSGVVSCVEDHM